MAILYYAKTNSEGFATVWRYFGFANQLVAVFALLMVSTYLKGNGKNYFISLLPGMFYTFIVSSYIFHDPKLGLNFDGRLGLEGYTGSYLVGLVFAILFAWFVAYSSKKRKDIILD